MSTSIIILDQNFNANYVDIMVFEPSVLFPSPPQFGGGIEHMVQNGTTTIRTNDISYNSQKPDISFTDNWYKNETEHFVQKTFRTKLN